MGEEGNPEQVNTPAPSGDPGQPTPAPSGGSTAPSDSPKYVTEESFQKVLARMDAQSKILAGLQKSATPPPPPPKPDDDRLTLKRQNDELKALRETVFNNKRIASIEAAVATKLGERTESFRKYVMAVHGERIKVGDDMNVFVEDNGSHTPVVSWLEAFLETDDGKIFLPAPNSGPAGDGLRTPSGGQQPAKIRFLDMPLQKIWEEREKDRAGFNEYVEANPEHWERKRKGT